MKGDTFITFRGIADCCLVYDVDLSGPGTGATVVEWYFSDQDAADAIAVKPITSDEEDVLLQTCVDAAVSKQHDDASFYDPVEWRD